MRSVNVRALSMGLIVATSILLPGVAFAGDSLTMSFVTHAAFFSSEMKMPNTIDPQAFIADPGAPEAVGPQMIKHAAGYRPASVGGDAASTPVYNAEGHALGMTLGNWLGATGSVTITGKNELTATFSGLKPGGVYSLFENHFNEKPIGFTPMDGAGMANNFTAGPDGKARVTMAVPAMPTHDNAVLLVYHSDGKAHGSVRGQIGVDAHHELIARPQ